MSKLETNGSVIHFMESNVTGNKQGESVRSHVILSSGGVWGCAFNTDVTKIPVNFAPLKSLWFL